MEKPEKKSLEMTPSTTPGDRPRKRRRLMGPVMVVLGLLLGGGVSVGLLLWAEQHRHEQLELERVAALRRLDESPKPAPPVAPEEPPAPKDPLLGVNEQFRDIYRLVRAEAVAHADPIVVVSGDDLILLHKGDRKPVVAVPPLYHELKTYAHVPLAAYLVTTPEPGATEVPSVRQQEMKKLLDRILELHADLPKRGYSPDLQARQEKLLSETAAFLEATAKKADSKAREAFAAKMREPILANVRDAAQEQIKSLDKQMTKWRSDLSEAEWKQLKVVVIGSAMPRRKNLAVQYFAFLLKEPADDSRSKRIIYAESLFEEQKALNLLGTHVVDEGIGRAFFGEPTRMRRDLLGDAAEEILDEMYRGRADR
jgi:hypothetical protein